MHLTKLFYKQTKLVKQMLKPLLVAFDFDHTIIDDNSDIVVRNLIPTTEIPAEVQDLYRSDGWTAYMQQIFYILHSKGITSAQIKDVINKIPVIPGLDDVMKFLHKNNSEIIVVSDSNSVFINEWLKNASLDSLINHVFTNPARFNPEGCLEIEMYHAQDWCTICTKNLCKGHILDTYIEDRKKNGVDFSRVVYVGDGKNDFCPCSHLSENDFVFPREGYALVKLITQSQSTDNKDNNVIKANVYPWNCGKNILDIVSTSLSNMN